jgi:lipooligosaccharide transport system permease protein
MRSWQDFDYVTMALMPMFLFSTGFYPLSVYPRPLQVVIECTPLFHAVAMTRALTLGGVGWGLAWHALYLAVMAAVGLVIAARRLDRLLLS